MDRKENIALAIAVVASMALATETAPAVAELSDRDLEQIAAGKGGGKQNVAVNVGGGRARAGGKRRR